MWPVAASLTWFKVMLTTSALSTGSPMWLSVCPANFRSQPRTAFTSAWQHHPVSGLGCRQIWQLSFRSNQACRTSRSGTMKRLSTPGCAGYGCFNASTRVLHIAAAQKKG